MEIHRIGNGVEQSIVKMTPVGFEPTPFRNGALSHRLRPLGQSVLGNDLDSHSIVHCSSGRTL